MCRYVREAYKNTNNLFQYHLNFESCNTDFNHTFHEEILSTDKKEQEHRSQTVLCHVEAVGNCVALHAGSLVCKFTYLNYEPSVAFV